MTFFVTSATTTTTKITKGKRKENLQIQQWNIFLFM